MKYFITKNDAYAIDACIRGVEQYANGRDEVSVRRALKDAENMMTYHGSYTWEYILTTIVYKYKLAQAMFDYLKPFHVSNQNGLRHTQEFINTQDYAEVSENVVNCLYLDNTHYHDTSFRGPFMAWLYNEVKKTGQSATVALEEETK